MLNDLASIVAFTSAGLALCGCAYYVLCLTAAFRFLQVNRSKRRPFTPAISVLKPLRGADREMYAAFRSHCLQNYPEFEIIFGVSEPDDPAISLVERLRAEFPNRHIELLVCDQKLGSNLKVSNLVQMLPKARFDFILVNDSDIRVGPDYLEQVMAPLADERVGMVTALYRGAPGQTPGSRLEAVGIETDFAAGVLSARLIEGELRFGLGSTLAVSRSALEAIGGFEPLLDYLADDYELGKRITETGRQVELAWDVVDTCLPNYSFGEYRTHQLRWMRGIRAARGGGFAGMLLTFGLPFAVFAVFAAGGAHWSLGLLTFTLLLRFSMAWMVTVLVLRDRPMLRHFWLLPFRDFLALVFWAEAYASDTIVWRGNSYTLRNGKLEPRVHQQNKVAKA